MIDVEKLANQIMKECEADGEPVSYEDAKTMAEMEIKAKSQRNYTTTEKSMKKKSKPRVTKVSDEKKAIFDNILQNLDRCEGVSRENIQILKENKLISVQIGDTIIKIDSIEQRKPKK
jgi:hypothetical protein